MKKNLFKILAIALALVCFISSIPAEASAASYGPWVADPYSVFGADAEYVSTETIPGGNTYDYYVYYPVMTFEEIIHAIARYGVGMEGLGYEIWQLTLEGEFGIGYTGYEKDGLMAEIIFDANEAVDYANLDREGEIRWIVLMAIPEGMTFVPGEGLQGISADGEDICKLCEGDGRCTFCHGKGHYFDGKKYESCRSCTGTGVCCICGGAGIYD